MAGVIGFGSIILSVESGISLISPNEWMRGLRALASTTHSESPFVPKGVLTTLLSLGPGGPPAKVRSPSVYRAAIVLLLGKKETPRPPLI